MALQVVQPHYRAITSFYNGDILWISSGELSYNWITETVEHISTEAKIRTNLKEHPIGTFLMAITGLEAEGTRGRCAFVGKPATTNQSCMAIYPTSKLITEYLFYFYRQYANYLAFKYCQGTKQQSYTAKIVKQLPICSPSDIQEQQAIAEVLYDIDALIDALNKQIEKKKNIKQGAMQELLTGKKRLQGFTEKWSSEKLGSLSKMYSGGNTTFLQTQNIIMVISLFYQYLIFLILINIFIIQINEYQIRDYNIVLLACFHQILSCMQCMLLLVSVLFRKFN